MHSLRSRLLLLITAVVVLVLVVAGMGIYWTISRSLKASFDQGLVDQAIALSTLIEVSEAGIQSEIVEHGFDPFQRAHRPKYYEVWSADGSLIERSTALGEARLPEVNEAFDREQLRRLLIRDADLADGQPARLLAWDFEPTVENDDKQGLTVVEKTSDRPGARLVLAKETLGLEHDLRRLRDALMAILVAAALAAAPAIWWVTGAALRPLLATAERIATIGPDDLSTQLAAADAPTETRVVIERLNALLARLRTAFQKEQAFTANVAHELRTPMAGLRANMEMILSSPRDPADYQDTIEKCLGITVQTEGVVESLLRLCRADAHQLPTVAETINADQALRDAWQPFSSLAAEKSLSIVWTVDDGLTAWADQACVEVILRNLFDNATSYTQPGGEILLSAQSAEATTRIRVENTGCRLTQEQMMMVGQRFWRGDASRSATGRHAGLGLALSIELAALQGGRLELTCNPEGRFYATLYLPTSSDSSSRRPAPLAYPAAS